VNIFGLGIGWPQLALILLVACVLVGPEKLPDYARKAAKFVRRIRKITSSVTNELSKSIGLDDEDSNVSVIKKDITDIRKSLEHDIAELKGSFNEQSKSVSQSIESSTKETMDTIKQNTKDISASFKSKSSEVEQTPDEQESVATDIDGIDNNGNDAFASESETTAESAPEPVAQTTIEPPKEEPLPTPIITPKDAITTPPVSKESQGS